MSNIIGINDRKFVRFFSNPVECEDCGEETSGYVFENSQQVVCSRCRGVMLEAEVERVTTDMVIIFTPEDDDE